MRIQTKTIIIFLVLSLLPLAFIGAMAYHLGKKAIESGLGSTFQQIAHEAMDKVDRSLYEVYHNVQTWSKLELMQEVITRDVDGKISSFLMGLNRQYGYYSSINALNVDGTVIASSYPSLIGQDFSGEKFYRAAMQGEPYLEDVHYNDLDRAWVMTFSFPIKAHYGDDETILGVLSARCNFQNFMRMTHLARRTSDEFQYIDLILIRNDGLVISAPENQIGELFGLNLIKKGLASANLVSHQREGFLIEDGASRSELLVGYDFSRGYKQFPGFGWGTLATRKVAEAFAPIERLKLVIMSIGAGVALLVIITSLIIARRMTRPIVMISQAAHRVAQGNFDKKVEYVSRDEIGYLAASFNQMTDDLKEQSRALKQLKDYLQNILDQSPALIITTDREGNMVQCNKAVKEILGYEAGGIQGKSLGFLWADREAWEEASQMIRYSKSHLNCEMTCRHRNGHTVPVSYSISPLLERNGKATGAIFIGMDISGRKQLEARLIESERHAAFSYFTSTVIHDIRTPLIGIHNTLMLLSERKKNEVLTLHEKQMLKELVNGTELLLGIVNDRLDVYQGNYMGLSMQYSSFLLSQAVEQVITLLKFELQRLAIQIVVENPEPDLVVVADRGRMQRVFINLLDNAIKHSPLGGRVWIRFHCDRENGSSYLTCQIQDCGSGISENDAESLFQPKRSSAGKKGGRGLGLRFCRIVIEAHGGRIWAENVSGGGARFNFQFPLKERVHADQGISGG